MDSQGRFYEQLAKSIQTWLHVETETYLLYAAIMHGANSHLVSVTFHNIESFESKLGLINSCLALVFDRESKEWKQWKNLFNRAKKLNKKRNKIVHEPAIVSVTSGVESIAISPSFLNAQALVRGQTTYNGPVIGPQYEPQMAKILEDHKMDQAKLFHVEKAFKELSEEIRQFRELVAEPLKSTQESAFSAKDDPK